MKILFTNATLLHGGAERVISILANEFVGRGIEVEIQLYYDSPIWYELDKRVLVNNDEKIIGKANPIKHIIYRNSLFKNSDADIIVSFLAPMNIINIIASRFSGKRIIVADRNDPRRTPVNPMLRGLRNFLYRYSDGVVLQSQNNRKYFSEKVQKKSKVIFNPVDVKDYKGVALKTEKNDEIVSVGRLINQKNPYMLLEAFARIANKYPSYKLTYYGEGELKEELKKKASFLGLSDRVSFPGAVKDIFSRIQTAKIFVMTSNYEGMPNALIEAMCIGIPVISTRVSGAVDLIVDRKNGRLVDCNSSEQLRCVLEEMLDHYSEAINYAQEALSLNSKLEVSQISSDWLKYIGDVIDYNECKRV